MYLNTRTPPMTVEKRIEQYLNNRGPEQTFSDAKHLLVDARIELLKLRKAITDTIDENGHLADGDVCTLIKLKRAIDVD